MPKKMAKTVRYRDDEPHYPATALPFYKDTPKMANYWCLPATGEYYGGKDAGKAMALAYLKHIAETDDDTPLLGYVVLSMRERMAERAGPEPLPSLPDVQPLPYEALPSVLRAYVQDIAERMQCPPDFPAVACVAMAGAALGRKIGIRPKQEDSWTVIANQWAMIVGKSGIMKSPAMSEALKPLRKMQADAFQQHEHALEEYEVQTKLSKIQSDEADRAARDLIKKGNKEAAVIKLEAAQADAKDPPTAKRYIINDSTVEALAETLQENQNGILVDRDELAGWLRSLDIAVIITDSAGSGVYVNSQWQALTLTRTATTRRLDSGIRRGRPCARWSRV